jgi:hypothetical protein
MTFDLTDDEKLALVALLRDTIAANRFPLSPQIRALKAILAQLEPRARPEPLPPMRQGERSTIVAKRRRSARRG